MRKILIITLVSLALIMTMCGCSKAQVEIPKPQPDTYSMVIDQYSPDTARLLNRTVWWQDVITKDKEIRKLESAKDLWSLMCPTPNRPQGWIEHIYYLKNGKKIQPSVYPKQWP